MKKLIISFLVIVMFSCGQKGEMMYEPQDFIIIHGKTYKIMKVYPVDGSESIWIMYPKDSLGEVPQTINYKSGKTNQTIIQVR